MNKAEILKESLEDVQENYLLRPETRIETGGVAEFFYSADNLANLISAITAAIAAEVSYLVIGSGANVLFSDFGFRGFVIKNKSANISFLQETSQVIVDSGVSLSKLALEASARDLAGLEPFISVPGTIGAAVCNNISVFSSHIANLVKSATILFPKENGESQILKKNHDWFEFSAKGSKLGQINSPKPIILSIKLQLAHNKKEDILSRLANYQKLSRKIFPLKEKSLMIFKEELAEGRSVEEFFKALDRFKVGQKTISLCRSNLNFVRNCGKATSADVRLAIERIKNAISEKTGVVLTENIEYFGNWVEEDASEGVIDEKTPLV